MSFIGAPAAAAISSAANIAIADQTNDTNKSIANSINKTQMDLWREQQQHDLDMWNRENAYNDPQAQMQRLVNAGINPLAILGSSGNATGLATGSAGGQIPPQLNVPQMQMPNLDFTSLSQAYKNFQDGRKASSEADIFGIDYDRAKELALQGVNPDMIAARVSLETYNKLKGENKYQQPFIEAQIRKMNSERDYNAMVTRERKLVCQQVKEQTKGIKLQNNFNSQQFPQQLKLLTEQIKTEVQNRINQTGLAAAQINAANASAENMQAQASLTEKQGREVEERVVKEQFLNGLRRLGINADDKNLPFFATIAAGLVNGTLSDAQVADYFQLLAHAERVGMNKLWKSNANLTKFNLFGNSGSIGTNFNMGMNQLFMMFKNSPKGSASVVYPQ